MPGLSLGLRLGLSPAPSKGGGMIAGLDLNFVNGRYALNSPYSAAFPAGWVFSRSGAGLAQKADGSWASFATGVPRITDKGLLVEEARTNGYFNSACTGTGGGMGLPDTWTQGGTYNGTLAIANLGGGTEGGLPYVDVRLTGTPSATTTTGLYFSSGAAVTGQVPAASGQTWTASVFARVIGTPVGVSGYSTLVLGRDAGAASTEGSGNQPATVTGTRQRFSQTLALANVNTARIHHGFQVGVTNGVPVDVTVRLYAPQIEQGAFATSPIITSGAAGTRGADTTVVTGLASMVALPFVLAATAEIPNADGQTLTLGLVNANNAVANSLRLSRANTNDARGQSVSGGGVGATSNVFPKTGARTLKMAVRLRTGELRASVDGALGANVTGNTDPVGMNQVASGHFAGSNWLNGYLQRLQVSPGDMADAQLQAMTT